MSFNLLTCSKQGHCKGQILPPQRASKSSLAMDSLLYDETAFEKLSEIKKPIFIYDWLYNLEKRLLSENVQIIKDCQEDLVQQLLTQLSFAPGIPTHHLLGCCLANLFVVGDFRLVYTALNTCNGLLKSRDEGPASINSRLAALRCLGVIYKRFGRMLIRAFEDSVLTMLKLIKQSESQVRYEIMNTLCNLLDGVRSEAFMFRKEIFKAVKLCMTDRVLYVRLAAGKCLYQMLDIFQTIYTTDLESTVNLCLKSLDGANYAIRLEISRLLGHLLCKSLNENSVPSNTTPVNAKQNYPSIAGSNAANTSISRPKPTSLPVVLSLLHSGFLKGSSGFLKSTNASDMIKRTNTINHEVRIGVTYAYVQFFIEMGPSWFEANLDLIMEHLFDHLLANPRALPNPTESIHSRQYIHYILCVSIRHLLTEPAQLNVCKKLIELLIKQLNSMNLTTTAANTNTTTPSSSFLIHENSDNDDSPGVESSSFHNYSVDGIGLESNQSNDPKNQTDHDVHSSNNGSGNGVRTTSDSTDVVGGDTLELNSMNQNKIKRAFMNHLRQQTINLRQFSNREQYQPHLIICQLNILSQLIRWLDSLTAHLLDQSGNSLDDILLNYLKHPVSSVRLAASVCLRQLVLSLPNQRVPLLVRCLTNLKLEQQQLQDATLASTTTSQSANQESGLLGYGCAIGALLVGHNSSIWGISSVLAKKIFMAGEDLIRGANQNSRLTLARTQAGWNVLAAYMTLGACFVKPYLGKLLVFWRNAFPATSKDLVDEKQRGDSFTWQVMLETRVGALCSIQAFLEYCAADLLNDDVLNRLLHPLEMAIIMLSHLNDIVRIYGNHLRTVVGFIRLRLYQILLLLPPATFSGTYNILLRELVAEFTISDSMLSGGGTMQTSLLKSIYQSENNITLGSWSQETDQQGLEEHLHSSFINVAGAIEHDPACLFLLEGVQHVMTLDANTIDLIHSEETYDEYNQLAVGGNLYNGFSRTILMNLYQSTNSNSLCSYLNTTTNVPNTTYNKSNISNISSSSSQATHGNAKTTNNKSNNHNLLHKSNVPIQSMNGIAATNTTPGTNAAYRGDTSLGIILPHLSFDLKLDNQPLPLQINLVNQSIYLFGKLFPFMPIKYRTQIMEHLIESVRNASKSAKQQEFIQCNSLTALLIALRCLNDFKASFGNDALNLRKVTLTLILSALTSPYLLVRCAAGECLGRLGQILDDPTILSDIVQQIFERLRAMRNPIPRAGHCLAIGCLHRFVGGLASGQHLSSSVGNLLSIAQDSSVPEVQMWALHSLALIADSGGPIFREYLETALSLVLQLLLKSSCPIHEIQRSLTRLFSALITILGPELRGSGPQMDNIRQSCVLCCNIMKNSSDSFLQAQYISCSQQLHLFAPLHVNLNELIPQLQLYLTSPHLILRRVSVACLRQLSQKQALNWINTQTSTDQPNSDSQSEWNSFESVLFNMLDVETDYQLRRDIEDILISQLQFTGLLKLKHWFRILKEVLQISTTTFSDQLSSLQQKTPDFGDYCSTREDVIDGEEDVDEYFGRKPQTTSNAQNHSAHTNISTSSDVDEDDGYMEDQQFGANPTQSQNLIKLITRSSTRVFALNCIRHLISNCAKSIRMIQCNGAEDARDVVLLLAHFDLAKARLLRGKLLKQKRVSHSTTVTDWLIFYLPDFIRASFVSATSDSNRLRLTGLNFMRELIRHFASVPDPDQSGHMILEQYAAQIMAAIKSVFCLNQTELELQLQQQHYQSQLQTDTISNVFTPNPDLFALGCQISAAWICSGIARDLNNSKGFLDLLLKALDLKLKISNEHLIANNQAFKPDHESNHNYDLDPRGNDLKVISVTDSSQHHLHNQHYHYYSPNILLLEQLAILNSWAELYETIMNQIYPIRFDDYSTFKKSSMINSENHNNDNIEHKSSIQVFQTTIDDLLNTEFRNDSAESRQTFRLVLAKYINPILSKLGADWLNVLKDYAYVNLPPPAAAVSVVSPDESNNPDQDKSKENRLRVEHRFDLNFSQINLFYNSYWSHIASACAWWLIQSKTALSNQDSSVIDFEWSSMLDPNSYDSNEFIPEWIKSFYLLFGMCCEAMLNSTTKRPLFVIKTCLRYLSQLLHFAEFRALVMHRTSDIVLELLIIIHRLLLTRDCIEIHLLCLNIVNKIMIGSKERLLLEYKSSLKELNAINGLGNDYHEAGGDDKNNSAVDNNEITTTTTFPTNTPTTTSTSTAVDNDLVTECVDESLMSSDYPNHSKLISNPEIYEHGDGGCLANYFRKSTDSDCVPLNADNSIVFCCLEVVVCVLARYKPDIMKEIIENADCLTLSLDSTGNGGGGNQNSSNGLSIRKSRHFLSSQIPETKCANDPHFYSVLTAALKCLLSTVDLCAPRTLLNNSSNTSKPEPTTSPVDNDAKENLAQTNVSCSKTKSNSISSMCLLPVYLKLATHTINIAFLDQKSNRNTISSDNMNLKNCSSFANTSFDKNGDANIGLSAHNARGTVPTSAHQNSFATMNGIEDGVEDGTSHKVDANDNQNLCKHLEFCTHLIGWSKSQFELAESYISLIRKLVTHPFPVLMVKKTVLSRPSSNSVRNSGADEMNGKTPSTAHSRDDIDVDNHNNGILDDDDDDDDEKEENGDGVDDGDCEFECGAEANPSSSTYSLPQQQQEQQPDSTASNEALRTESNSNCAQVELSQSSSDNMQLYCLIVENILNLLRHEHSNLFELDKSSSFSDCCLISIYLISRICVFCPLDLFKITELVSGLIGSISRIWNLSNNTITNGLYKEQWNTIPDHQRLLPETDSTNVAPPMHGLGNLKAKQMCLVCIQMLCTHHELAISSLFIKNLTPQIYRWLDDLSKFLNTLNSSSSSLSSNTASIESEVVFYGDLSNSLIYAVNLFVTLIDLAQYSNRQSLMNLILPLLGNLLMTDLSSLKPQLYRSLEHQFNNSNSNSGSNTCRRTTNETIPPNLKIPIYSVQFRQFVHIILLKQISVIGPRFPNEFRATCLNSGELKFKLENALKHSNQCTNPIPNSVSSHHLQQQQQQWDSQNDHKVGLLKSDAGLKIKLKTDFSNFN